jgi:hypothetical protein
MIKHFETAANAVLGILFAQGILWFWGIPFKEAASLNLAMFAVSYARSYILRRLFASYEAASKVSSTATSITGTRF